MLCRVKLPIGALYQGCRHPWLSDCNADLSMSFPWSPISAWWYTWELLGGSGWLLLRLCRWYWSGPARWGLLCYCYSPLCSITPSGAGPPSAGDWVSTPGYLIGKIHIWMSWCAPWHVTHSNSWKKVKGLKTQKVLIILKALFPNIRILLSPVYYSFL